MCYQLVFCLRILRREFAAWLQGSPQTTRASALFRVARQGRFPRQPNHIRREPCLYHDRKLYTCVMLWIERVSLVVPLITTMETLEQIQTVSPKAQSEAADLAKPDLVFGKLHVEYDETSQLQRVRHGLASVDAIFSVLAGAP